MVNPKSLGLAGGVFFGGIVMFLGTLIAWGTGYGTSLYAVWVGTYPWYSVTPVGSVLGLIYGFLDGFIGLYVFAWLYNWFNKKFAK